MANERAMTAESVNHVLNLARTRPLSGRLTIAQQSGGRIQEGEMHLQAGQPVFVRCESMVGQEALLTLLSWRSVQYTFQQEEPGMTPFGLPAGNTKDTTPDQEAARQRLFGGMLLSSKKTCAHRAVARHCDLHRGRREPFAGIDNGHALRDTHTQDSGGRLCGDHFYRELSCGYFNLTNDHPFG